MEGKGKCAFTLIEMMIVIMMLAVLAGTCLFIFRAVLAGWSSQERRTGLAIALENAVRRIAGDLREAKAMDSLYGNEVRFTSHGRDSRGMIVKGADEYYIYYFYNADDSYPPVFDRESYQLKRSSLSGVVSGLLTTGVFTYGDGRIVVNNVLPPPLTGISLSGSMAVLDIRVQDNDEIMTIRTEVKERNR